MATVISSKRHLDITSTTYESSGNVEVGGRVGIGTDNPLDLIHAKSSTTDSRMILDGFTGFDSELKFAENGVVKYTIGNDAASNNFVIGTINVDTNPRMVIDSSGRVGIGTAAPAEKLDVIGKIVTSGRNYTYGQENYHIKLTEDSAVSAYVGNVNGSAYLSNGSYYGSQIYNITTGQIGLSTIYLAASGDTTFLNNSFSSGSSTAQGTERMRIQSSGHVGINTTTPLQRFHVEGTAYFGGGTNAAFQSGGDTRPNTAITIDRGDKITVRRGQYLRTLLWQDSTNDIIKIGETGTSLIAGINLEAGHDGSTGSAQVRVYGGSTEYVRFDGYNKKVGIGETSPYEKLHVNGKLYVNSGQVWDATTQGTGRGSIHLDPNTATDHAGGAITWGASDSSNGESAQAGIYVRSDGSYGTKMYFSTTDSYASGSKTRMTILSNGNVGVGTNAPVARLSVAQPSSGDTTMLLGRINGKPSIKADSSEGGYLILDSHANAAAINHYSSNNVWIATGGGNVGIRTTSPSVALDVNSTDAIAFPTGTTAQRPSSPAAGMLRYNSTEGQFEGYTTEWGSIGGGEDYTPLAVTKNGSNQFVFNFADAVNFSCAATGTWTFNPTVVAADVGKSGVIIINNTGTTTPGALPSVFKTPNGDAIVFETDSGDTSIISYFIASTTKVLVNYVGNFS